MLKQIINIFTFIIVYEIKRYFIQQIYIFIEKFEILSINSKMKILFDFVEHSKFSIIFFAYFEKNFT